MKELGIHPYVENAWQLLCPDAFNVIKELDAAESSYRLSAGDNLTEVVDLLMKLHNTTFIEVSDKNGQRIAGKKGWEYIPIGRVEARTQSDLKGAKPLMVGPTSLGVMCTITHPDIGIALSHQDVFTKDIEKRLAEAILSEKGTENKLVESLAGINQIDINAWLNPYDAINTVQRAVREAVQSFGEMFETLGVTNFDGSPEIVVCGLAWCEQINSERFAQIISNDLATVDVGRGTQAILSVETGAGSKIIVYGGSTHTQFSSPTRFTIRNEAQKLSGEY